MSEPRPLVALIHAVPSGARIAQEAFAREFPEARLWNVLDDRLLDDALVADGLTEPLRRRMLRLIAHVMDAGDVQGVLLTCSSYGEVVESARSLWGTPILRSDEAMFRAALAGPYDRIAVAASVPPAVPAAVAQLEALVPFVRGGGRPVEISAVLSEAAAAADSPEATAAHLADALRAGGADSAQAVLPAQYSLAPAGETLAGLMGVPVLDGAGTAARELRALLLEESSPHPATVS
ncbi:aspartate/glutamate racemase family protein [Streptomyces sp. NPDC059010]|uniref:aspartate/glutamate racemase family protein n=1 Tax=Streptomyces sp. NPDC059010 TaxID=3346695 RepID=UPI0036BB86D2